jgi:hypothetical protein
MNGMISLCGVGCGTGVTMLTCVIVDRRVKASCVAVRGKTNTATR